MNDNHSWNEYARAAFPSSRRGGRAARPSQHVVPHRVPHEGRARVVPERTRRLVLWKATVRVLIPRSAATSFIGMPRASRRTTSLARGVIARAVRSPADCRPAVPAAAWTASRRSRAVEDRSTQPETSTGRSSARASSPWEARTTNATPGVFDRAPSRQASSRRSPATTTSGRRRPATDPRSAPASARSRRGTSGAPAASSPTRRDRRTGGRGPRRRAGAPRPAGAGAAPDSEPADRLHLRGKRMVAPRRRRQSGWPPGHHSVRHPMSRLPCGLNPAGSGSWPWNPSTALASRIGRGSATPASTRESWGRPGHGRPPLSRASPAPPRRGTCASRPACRRSSEAPPPVPFSRA
jgi:hypothetical protein